MAAGILHFLILYLKLKNIMLQQLNVYRTKEQNINLLFR